MPNYIIKLREQGEISYYSKKEIWFHVKNVASYYIKDGNTIIVEPCENADRQVINIYIMCSSLGFIMIQRNMVAIHGATIVINNKAIILTGNRGAGKSTLSTALRLKGYKFISDDVAATYLDESIKVCHGFPYQKLCEDSMNKLGYDKNNSRSFNSDGQIKYLVAAKGEFVYEDTELEAIIKIEVGDVSKVTLEEIKGIEKVNLIINNVYRGEFLRYLNGATPIYLKKCLDIAKNIKAYKIIRPKNKFTVDEQIQLIEKEVTGAEELAI